MRSAKPPMATALMIPLPSIRMLSPVVGALAFLLGGGLHAQTSTLVYENAGALTYGTYANQGQANAVNTVPDFSRAGYKGGGVAIPFVPTVVTVNAPTGGDDTALIQNAIDTVAAMSVQANGFRGAVLIKAGNYQVANTLTIGTSGIVVRGEGNQANGGTKITMTATVQDNLFEVSGSGSPSLVSGSTQAITDSYVPSGAKSFNVADASGYSVGDRVRVHNLINDQWIIDLGMHNLSTTDPADSDWTAAGYQLIHEREVAAINGNEITLDASLVQAIEDQYGGGQVFKYTFSGQLENIGFEGLRLESAFLSDTDEAHGWIGVKFNDVRNVWMRQVTGRYFGYGLVSIGGTCHHFTIQDCAMLDPKSITTGGRKYSFNIDDATYVLMQRCYTRGGRHDFVSGSKTPGPNVFVDCLAEQTNSDVGPHHRYATGQLYDNVKCGPLNVQNRRNSGSGHGWSGAQVMFWNCDATSLISESPTGAMNWAVGCKGTFNNGGWVNEPDGIRESNGVHVTPRSLYYRQLEERSGIDAVRKVIVPVQDDGTIWTDMSAWAGEGLYSDDVVAWASADLVSPPTDSVNLTGRVRNLIMLENGVTTTWSKFSGPGTVTFGNDAQLDTTATFGTQGTYVIRLTADDGVTTASFDLTVIYSDAAPTVTYHGNGFTGGSVPVDGSSPYTPGATVTVLGAGDMTRSGHTFFGWNTASDGSGTGYGPTDTFTINNDVILYAQWSHVATLLSVDEIVGIRQANATALGYYPDANSNLVGTGGSNTTETRETTNIVLGYSLPTLPYGTTVDSATFLFEITSNRDNSGLNAAIQVHLLDVADPDGTGFTYFHSGTPDNNANTHLVGSTHLEVGTGEVSYADDEQDQSYTLPAGALSVLQTYYGGDHIPERAEIFFRFSLDQPADISKLDRYRIDIASDESSLQITATAPPVDPFATWAALDGGGVTFGGDTNGDGIADGLAWLIDSASPAVDARSLMPGVQESTGDLVSSFRALKAPARGNGVLKLQYSRDLGVSDAWTNHTITVPDTTATVGGVDFVITPNVGENHHDVQATIPASAAGAEGRIFMRLLAEPGGS